LHATEQKIARLFESGVSHTGQVRAAAPHIGEAQRDP
jgi:hypothetical protein